MSGNFSYEMLRESREGIDIKYLKGMKLSFLLLE